MQELRRPSLRTWLVVVQLLAMTGLAFALRGWVAVTSTRVPAMDETSYDATGWSIASGEGYVLNGRVAFKAPLYSAFLAGIYALAGREYRAVRLVQAGLGATLCLLMVGLGWMLLGRREGLIAGWITAVYPPFVALPERLLSEGLFVWLAVASLVLLVAFSAAPRWWTAILVGMSCGLSALARSIALGLVAVFAGLVLARHRQWIPPAKRAVYASLICVACVATVAPWTTRNWVKLGAFVPISTEGGRAFYAAWVAIPDGKRLGFGILDPTVARTSGAMGEVEGERYLYRETFTYLRQHPGDIFRLLVLKTLSFWSPFEWEIMSHGRGVYNGGYVFLLPFALLGVLSVRRSRPGTLWLCGAVVGYFFVFSVIYGGIPRYRVPIEPVLILLASSGMLAFLLPDGRWRGTRIALGGGWLAANLIAVLYSAEVKTAARTALEWAGIW